MGLFGALFAGVSGLNSQSNKIGVISNNISNVNTVGYKQGAADFDTLVVPSGTTSFSPGGVIGGNSQLVNQQGIISATKSSTDVAISGSGLIVVNTKPDGTGNTYYTRSGSFTQDSAGNFLNSNGYYLQGLPLQANGTTQQANQLNLRTVSVNQSATGAATATSALAVSANLNAGQSVLLGNGATATMAASNGTSTVNVGANGNQILVGNDIASAATASNALVRGNTLDIVNGIGGTTQTDTFRYDGFNIGRSANTGAVGDGGNALDSETLAGTAISNTGTTNDVAVTVTTGAHYTVGQHIYISGASAINGIPASEINGEHVITSKTGNVVHFATITSGAAAGAHNSTTSFGSSNRTYEFTGNVLNATSVTGDFMGVGSTTISPATFTSLAIKFSITVGSDTPQTFTYSSTPSPTQSTFNSVTTLANAINNTSDLTATVQNGRLYVSAKDANQAVVFANGDAAGDGIKPGIDWLQELDLGSISSGTGATLQAGGTTNWFNSLNGLAQQVNLSDPINLVATVNNPTGTATLSINEANPQQTITFTNGQNNNGLLTELGFKNISVNGAGKLSTGLLDIVYNSSSPATDMSSGAVTPQFSKDITVYDSQGTAHTVALNFVKIGNNQWAVELTAVPASDVVSSVVDSAHPTGDGQIASGTLTFNGNGELTGALGSISSEFTANWTTGSSSSTLTMDLGVGLASGLIQTAGAFNVSSATQNGSPVGELTGVSIDGSGFVIASFSNGQTQKLYQIPLAAVNNPNGMKAVSGNAYIETIESGTVNLQIAGTSGVGTFSTSALEQSNVDLSTQLTDLIVAQQAYGANSKVLTITDQLLQQLDQIIQ